VAVFLAVAGLLPIVVMLLKSVMTDGRMSLALYRGLLTSGREWTLLRHSFVLALLTTLLAMSVGLPLGILLAKTDLYLRRLFAVLFTIPLLTPPYFGAVSWFGILGREGLVAQVLGATMSEVTSSWLFGLAGCVLVLFSTFMPIVMLLTMTCLKTISPRLEEAGRLVSQWPLVLVGITVPLILPGLLLAALLVFLLTIGEFGVPAFLRYSVFPVESFTQFSAFYNFGAATAVAVPLAVITFLALVMERAFLRERTYQLRPAPDGEQALLIRLGTSRVWFSALVGVLCFIIVVLPLGVLVSQSWSIRAYVEAVSRAGDSLLRSLGFAVVGATVLTTTGFLSGYLIHTRALPFWRSVDSLTLFLFALPSTVIGIGLVSLWNRPLTNFVYATPAIILLGYLAQYAALPSRITVSTLAQIPPSMEEAAQIVGAGWFRRLAYIVAPLAKRGLVAAWLVGYIFCLRDTGITVIVYPPGQDTLPVRIFTLMANSPQSLVAALCIIMIAATLLPLGVLAWVFKKAQNPK
jgi:iron(III) transport system permease protein